ncbi:MAG: hypothetical protein EAX86_02940 [Candidatus Heimdallarchaeota archaeon]|nr:hypothetical protein [Candidatus Heimdallarchaeota archaeon]
MSKKQMFGTIGLASFVFMLLLMVFSGLPGATWAPVSSTAGTSLSLLWDINGLFPAVLIQGFVLFAALLGVNLQFTPAKKH